MDVGEWASLTAAVATAAAGIFAGSQVLELRRDRQARERAEIQGVAVSWHVVDKPRQADSDGWATWVFEITAHNPGTLPIRNVEVFVDFPHDFTRPGGEEREGPQARRLNMGTAVLVGGASRTWQRAVRMEFDTARSLRAIKAEILFVDMDGRTHRNEWAAPAHSRRSG